MGVAVREKIKNSGIYWLFIRHAGERVSQIVGDKETAEDAANEIRREIRTGRFNIAAMKAARAPEKPEAEKPPVQTLNDYYKRFEKVYLATSVRQGTRNIYKTSFKHILPELGSLPLDEITRERMKDFVAHLTGKKYKKRIKVLTYPDPTKKRNPTVTYKIVEAPLSKTSIRIILSELCALLSHAVEENVITSNPALKLGKFYKQVKVVHDAIQPLSAEEVQAFLMAVRDRDKRLRARIGAEKLSEARQAGRKNVQVSEYYPVFLCALHTGMRAGELVGLQWGDIDFKGCFFLIRRQFTRGRIESTKTGKPRRVDMSDALSAELQALKKRRKEEYLGKGSSEIPEWVFCNGEGKPLDYYNLKHRHFEKCLDQAGLRRIRFHDLRHTYATLLLMQGESPVYIQGQLGHSSIKVTCDVYGHWIPGANRQAVNRLPLPAHAARSAAAD